MKRHVAVILFSLVMAPWGFGEILASVGGGTNVDLLGISGASPNVTATLTGSHSWNLGERLGTFLDWSGGGTYLPLSGSSAALATLSTGASYLSGGFLGRLQLSGIANPSSDEGFYGAATIDTLLSFGSIERSAFIKPRLSIVGNPTSTMRVGGQLGAILMAATNLVIKLTAEVDAALSAPLGQDRYLSPELSLDWYPEGALTAGLRVSYASSSSPVLGQLTTGGPLLPLDQWQRYSARIVSSVVVGAHGLLSIELPVDYYRKGYDAFDGTIDLGVPAWLLAAGPTARLRLPILSSTSLVGVAGAEIALSNNTVERAASPFVSVSVEVKLPEPH